MDQLAKLHPGSPKINPSMHFASAGRGADFMTKSDHPRVDCPEPGEWPKIFQTQPTRPDPINPRLVIRLPIFNPGIDTLAGDTGQPVVESQKEEERLWQREGMSADFLDELPVGLHWLSANGRILWANKAQVRMLGYSPEEFIGQPAGQFYVDPCFAKELADYPRKNERVSQEAQLRCKDGSVKYVLIDTQVSWEKGRFVHARCFTRDLTDCRQRERQILEISEREQRRIGQDLHDELCQHLAAMKFRSSLLEKVLEKKRPTAARQARALEKMAIAAIDRAYTLARGLHPVQLETKGLVSALKEMAANLAEVYGRKCLCRVREPVSIHDDAVAIHIYRIAQEAVVNAIRHGKARKIIVRLAEKGAQITLSVEDDGIGLPDEATKANGMGLHIMRYRARMIGATFSISGSPEGGTIVACSLPVENPPTLE
jgi:PAS domain S-box-containing protein